MQKLLTALFPLMMLLVNKSLNNSTSTYGWGNTLNAAELPEEIVCVCVC